jgi:hypothetical protein
MFAGPNIASRMISPAALIRPLPIFVGAIIITSVVILFNYHAVGDGFAQWLNPRSDKFYSAAFTFLTTFWGASLSVWALLKSRTTRYIERLQDNEIYKRFIMQYERRLLYGFGSLLLSFVIYVQDIKLPPAPDVISIVFVIWAGIYMCSIAALLVVIYTAREVL